VVLQNFGENILRLRIGPLSDHIYSFGVPVSTDPQCQVSVAVRTVCRNCWFF